MFRGRGRQPSLGLIFLLIELARIGVDNIPIVTLVTIGINVVNYLVNPLDLGVEDVCVSFTHVVYHIQGLLHPQSLVVSDLYSF